MPPFLLMSSICASYQVCCCAGGAIPKMLFAAGPTMLVSVTAIFICEFVTPGTPLTVGGHPGATAPLDAAAPAPPAAPGRAPAAACPPGAAPPAPPAAALAPAPEVPPAAPPLVSDPAPPPVARPPPADATFVEFVPLPGATSHTSRTKTITVATPALTRSPVGARRAHKRNSWLGFIGSSSM